MRIILVNILLFLLIAPALGQTISPEQNKYNLASSFFRNKEYNKAAPLFLELYESSKLNTYFDFYINSLVNAGEFEEAEKALKKEIRRDKNPNFYITLGYVYKQQNRLKDSDKTFQEVINDLKPNMGLIITVANSFFNRGEYSYAELAYIKGRQLIPGESFRNNLATVYAYQRNYERMMEEYLQLILEDSNNLPTVQARLNSLLRYDFDNTLRILVKREVLRYIQNMPDVLAYSRLLIWLFVQENNYKSALNQAIALDKRTKTEEANILSFAIGAAEYEQYEIAISGLNYLATRKPEAVNIAEVKREMVQLEYKKYINSSFVERTNTNILVQHFESVINEYGYNTTTAPVVRNYAHLLAFYMKKPDKALDVLESALASKNIDNTQYTLLRIELADLNVYTNNLWDAVLLYSQIIEANKNNPIGDEVKLKKAKLSYYLGDIEWAKAQLDVLKASTSKLIANDAMELSILIANHYEMDSILKPIQTFAIADLLIFQNQDSMAVLVLDSMLAEFPGHTLLEVALMRKAQIKEKEHDFATAIMYYQKVVEQHPFSSSADDALFRLASLTNSFLKDDEKSKELFKQILLNFPGSIYATAARERFREIRGDMIPSDPFDLFNEETVPRFAE